MDVLKFLSDAEKSPWGTDLSKDQILAMGAVFRQIEERNSQLRVELEQVKRVANDQAQLAAQLQKELDELKKAIIWYDDADSASECRRAQSHMMGLARKVTK